jgi:hypothetical protein
MTVQVALGNGSSERRIHTGRGPGGSILRREETILPTTMVDRIFLHYIEVKRGTATSSGNYS